MTGIDNVPQEQQPWTEEVRRSFRDPRELAAHLGLRLSDLPGLPARTAFPFLCPRPFASRMRRGDPSDPLLRQIWPDEGEDLRSDGERDDPVGDSRSVRGSGMIQKYAGRVLLVTSGACAVNCRYCFRQNFAYEDGPRGETGWEERFLEIERDESIHEVILSGGDPLAWADSVIQRVFERLSRTAHVRTLRIHTRLPVVIPSRVTPELCGMVGSSRLRVAVVLHCNHPSEIDGDLRDAVARLRDSGATVLNQAVLLRGVNDDDAVLEELSLRLWDAGVLPYYLHALDPVSGSSRFAVPDERGRDLVDAIRQRLPGYLVPRLVREIEGESSKTPLA